MPLYEYSCENDHKTERLRRVEERDDNVTCRTCGKPMKRVLSPPSVMPDGTYSYKQR